MEAGSFRFSMRTHSCASLYSLMIKIARSTMVMRRAMVMMRGMVVTRGRRSRVVMRRTVIHVRRTVIHVRRRRRHDMHVARSRSVIIRRVVAIIVRTRTDADLHRDLRLCLICRHHEKRGTCDQQKKHSFHGLTLQLENFRYGKTLKQNHLSIYQIIKKNAIPNFQ